MAASVARGGLWILCGVAIIAAFALTPTAKAGLLGGGGSASYCDPSSTRAFSQFGDSSNYARMLNGGFENGSTGWVLGGGAKVVAGNEPYYLSGNRSDSHSLLLPAGSSAYSGTVCFALGDWHLRFMAKRLSSSGGLHVQVIVPSLLGILSILDGGTVSGNEPPRDERGRFPLHPGRVRHVVPDWRCLPRSVEVHLEPLLQAPAP